MQPIVTDVAWFVCLFIMSVSPTKNSPTNQDAIWDVDSGVQGTIIMWGLRSP